MFWNFIKTRVESAVLAGVASALAKLDGDNAEDTEAEYAGAVTTLQLRILAAPKAKADEDTTGTRRKAKAAA